MIKEDLENLKHQLEAIEQNLQGNMSLLTEREEKFVKLDKAAKEIMETKSEEIVRLNIGGRKFSTTIKTLMSISDTLFYKIIITKCLDLKKEIFIDRNPDVFPYLLDYLRYKKINYSKFSFEELVQLKEEAEYFEILPVEQYLEDIAKEKNIVGLEVSAFYQEGSNPVGSRDYKVLSDRNLTTGICTTYIGWFMVELNTEHWIEEFEIGGFTGKSDWINSAGYGAGANIFTSTDKKTWTNVGTLPSNFGQMIIKHKIQKSKARWVKFEGSVYFGIGFLKFL
jgi:hypothetical protein